MSNELGLISAAVGILFNLILLITYVRITESGKLNWLLFASILLTAIIFGLDLSLQAFGFPLLSTLYLFEILRNLSWFSLLLNMLGVNRKIFNSDQLKNNRNLAGLALTVIAIPSLVLIDILVNGQLQVTNVELIT